MKTIIQILVMLVIGAGTYYAGARFGLPDAVMDRIDTRVSQGIEKSRALRSRFFGKIEIDTEDWLKRFNESADYDAAEGVEIVVEPASAIVPTRSTPSTTTPLVERPADASLPMDPATNIPEVAPETLHICLANISNAPSHDDELLVTAYVPRVSFEEVDLLAAPATNSCLSSGFGPRGASRKLHKGVDFFSATGGNVLAAGAGVVVEAVYRDDYGYMIVLDHGNGIYTRYAHLKRFSDGISVGTILEEGEVLGPIGNSGAYTNVVHLHYEVLSGDYATPARSFGLTPINPIRDF